MSAPGRRRPPKRRCPVCGGDVYAWQEDTPCRKCAAELRPDRSALVDEIKSRRAARRDEAGEGERTSENVVATPRPLRYGELPEGF